MLYRYDVGSELFYCTAAEHVLDLRYCSENTAHRLVKYCELEECSYLNFFSMKE